MKKHPSHIEILNIIKTRSGTPTKHTFSDSYLGNTHPRYPINAPALRKIARDWMKNNRELPSHDFEIILTSLIKGESSTEKCMAGILLDASKPFQRKFDLGIFDTWLNYLEGWAEVDSVCTGSYTISEIPEQWKAWKRLLAKLSISKNINKRRASVVLLCSPLRRGFHEELATTTFQNVDRLKPEKDILITKAISWVLRSAAVHHGALVKKYVTLNQASLPKIAVRETMTKLKTGRKTKQKQK